MSLEGAHACDEPAVLVIGETLVDIVESPGAVTAEYVGGSPANVAIGLARLGHRTTLATALGEDARGIQCLRQIQSSGATVANLGARRAATSTARAILDDRGAATYEFDLSWDLIAIDSTATDADHVHTGSIAAMLAPGAAIIHDELRTRREHATISYDPNIRPSIMGSLEQVRAAVERWISLSDIVKASEDDLEWLYAGRPLSEVAQAWNNLGAHLVVLTCGGEGAQWQLASDTQLRREPAQVDRVVDTVGAGDSFMAGLLSGLIDHGLAGAAAGRERLRRAEAAQVTPAITRAMSTSAVTVAQAGAYAPTRDELAERNQR